MSASSMSVSASSVLPPTPLSASAVAFAYMVLVRLQGTEFAVIKYALEQQGLRVRGDVPSVHNQRVEARTRVVLAPS